MSYRTILVHLNDERRLPGMLDSAISIAIANKAHLIGLAVLPPIIIVPDMDGISGAVIEQHRVAYSAQMKRMQEVFNAVCAKQGVSASWVALDCEAANPFGSVATVVVDQARHVDLVITGQTDQEWALTGQLDVGEEVVTEAGRPVLLVPKTAPIASKAKRILVGWNGSRESARAVFDAIPLLAAADDVIVVWLEPQTESGRLEEFAGTDICAALARHDVKCRVLHHIRLDRGVGPTLLSLSQEHGADMLVMGCYGHSRLREFILGGATRYVLDHMTVPVLMSH